MKRKIMATILTAVLACAISIPAFAAETETKVTSPGTAGNTEVKYAVAETQR